jgi:hypothetical protein
MERTQGQDLYEVLQVSPRAHPLIITKAFRLLAALYHPDNKETGDQETFKQLGHAYQILSDPVRRAAYDREHLGTNGPLNGSGPSSESESLQSSERRDWNELELRQLILRALYDVRRGRPYKPGLSLLVLSELFGCGIENLQYTLWYLRGKRYIDTTQEGDLLITVDGVDHLETCGSNGNGTRSGQNADPIFLPLLHDGEAELSLAQHNGRNGNGSPH